MKYLIIILLLIGCAPRPITVDQESEYGEDEVRHGGDTTFWRGKELGFLLTQNEGDVWVVIKMEKHYDRYSLHKWMNCDSAIIIWGQPDRKINPNLKCKVFESKIYNEKYFLWGQKTEWVFQYGEKYVKEIDP